MVTRISFLVLCLLLVPVSAKGSETRPPIEVLIPEGMPIDIKVQLDERQPSIAKYVIKRTAGEGACLANIIAVMVGKNDEIVLVDPMMGDNLIDPMSIATTDSRIVRILLIVETVETKSGKWVLDMNTDQLDIKSLVKNGAKALPRAKFIKHSQQKPSQFKQ